MYGVWCRHYNIYYTRGYYLFSGLKVLLFLSEVDFSCVNVLG